MTLLQPEPWNGTENVGVTIEAPTDRFCRNVGNYHCTLRNTKCQDAWMWDQKVVSKKSTLRNIPEEPSGSMKWGEIPEQLRNSSSQERLWFVALISSLI
jgi:hypothetical protein